ncbi:MAG: hypothetical protein K2M19_04845 [Muribaculaceae bacterium]|nr:hypothetical protein [Muribaculaceae bacterium]
MKHALLSLLGAAAFAAPLSAQIVSTPAYKWQGDSIIQGKYKAYSPDGISLISDYSAQPGYFMPIEKEWHLSRDLAGLPRLHTPNKLHEAVYNLGLEEMLNAVEPDTTLRTGKEWAGVWTRDVSYSIILSMAWLQPEASEISLRRKVSPTGRIIQDTGSGGAWPVSSDRMIWAIAAYELYKVTGSREWLEYIYPIIANSMEDDLKVLYTDGGMVRGETSFIDWREQSYPRWMQTADIFRSQSLSTSVVHSQALQVLSDIAAELGYKEASSRYGTLRDSLVGQINAQLWMPSKGYYAMYDYGRNFPILNPRAECLGESLAILYNVATPEQAASITENYPTTPFGAPVFFPQIADMPPYHNNALWPWVASYWALANAKTGNELGLIEAIGSVFRPAALFTTNKENLVIDNGDIATELNSSNMLWCLAGNLAITQRILFGITFTPDALEFHPFVPQTMAADRSLTDFRYRGATLDIHVSGYGNVIKEFKLDGRSRSAELPGDIKGHHKVEIVLADNTPEPMKVNHTANVKAPLTPIARLSHSPELAGEGVPANNLLQWNPIEYIHHYVVLRNGERVGTTRRTSWDATMPGEWQVIGVSDAGVESFASEPLDNFETIVLEMPAENASMLSPEVSYQPSEPIEGFHGAGFVELDHTSVPVVTDVDIQTPGTYSISLVYANGNGPVNTENKCAIRTIEVDGVPAGTVVMPHRGVANWNDWGMTNSVAVPLAPGTHRIGITFRPENENMNLNTNHALVDRVIIKKIGK